MRVHPSFLGTLALSASTLASAELNVRTVYQFASNDTWLENLAVRSNGLILATEIGPPASLLSFDPRSSSPKKNVIHTFSSVLGLSGITEAAHDVFYVTGANTTSDNISDPPKNATHVWRVDFSANADAPDIKLIARPTAPTGFNGLAAFNETIILASASYQDSIFAIDTTTGYTWEAIKDANLMSSINGLKVQDDFVYWTANGALYRAQLYSNVTAGPGELIVQSTAFDDFAVAPDGFRAASGRKFAYAATAAMNTVMQISFDLQGGRNLTSVIAGSLDSTEVAEPTGCAFGRGEGEMDWLYVTTGGASAVNVDVDGVEVAVGAQLLGIKLS
ncbi:hypothetical protein AtubIFM55763_003178 [Aspergillus tubingensis]|uniref:Uncharacterized protein n=2 Tax=Aspergillus subgen. Circumdati TaxID=2720871 RepID=A0A100IFY8_ASPNG|nr:ABC transporter family protein [Aspergillus tubingensis]GAQ40504.1 hypothetical protein AKAW_08547 [Aspergillus niger]GFN12518.1 ABC transporter family protein [Aspergillus tubingensis]GLA67691.1 hypothetical protein AtubIFM54640_011685 [Aspergillus tubingensis]GLA68113.1 hypothetical protein AtubIFM55763_003178 [Aspergillus tubingensis]GLA86349.1 hypothetical protein AtubIFM56815_010609 [Aspergillus tubingensis]